MPDCPPDPLKYGDPIVFARDLAECVKAGLARIVTDRDTGDEKPRKIDNARLLELLRKATRESIERID